MPVVTVVTYIAYMFCVFYYLSRIYGIPNAKLPTLIILMLVNSFIIYLPVYIVEFQFESIFMALYFLVLGIEIRYVFKQSWTNTVAALMCFTINFFGTRVVIIGVMALMSGQAVTAVMADLNNRLLVTILTCGILTPYILMSSRVLISRVVKFLFADATSLKLSCVLLSAVCINQFISINTLYSKTNIPNFDAVYQIKIGALSHVCFVVIMIIVFIYSKLKKASITYVDTTQEINAESLTIKKLEDQAKTDYFTDFFVRSVAMEKLSQMLEQKREGYIIYIDLDGLKYVNDRFGHEEGDWYIKTVSHQIKNIFGNDTIARIGGDEFLIVGSTQSEDSVENRTKVCYDLVKNLSQTHAKAYKTSISYGLRQVDKTNTLSCDELIESVDNEMYAFKRSKNLERKNTGV